MAEAAMLDLPYPETAVIERDTLEEQTEAIVSRLPERPLVLGGCCCSHIGAVAGLAMRGSKLGLVWLDAHGDLNIPETSPSGNLWGMPLRMILDDGLVSQADTALVGARNLDPGEIEYLAGSGIGDDVERALDGTEAVYVAIDVDVLDPSEASVFVPEPGGPTVDEVETILRRVSGHVPVAGVGVTGLVPDARNGPIVERLLAAVGL
jgi:arginase